MLWTSLILGGVTLIGLLTLEFKERNVGSKIKRNFGFILIGLGQFIYIGSLFIAGGFSTKKSSTIDISNTGLQLDFGTKIYAGIALFMCVIILFGMLYMILRDELNS